MKKKEHCQICTFKHHDWAKMSSWLNQFALAPTTAETGRADLGAVVAGADQRRDRGYQDRCRAAQCHPV